MIDLNVFVQLANELGSGTIWALGIRHEEGRQGPCLGGTPILEGETHSELLTNQTGIWGCDKHRVENGQGDVTE